MMFKLKQQPTRFALFLRCAQYFLFFLGLSALSYCAFVLGETWGFQAYQTRRFDSALKDSPQSARAHTQAASLPLPSGGEAGHAHAESPSIKVVTGSLLGRIEIPSIGLTAMIMEGIDGKTLQLAVGHIPGTAIPGQQGNVGLAAHRDTFFRSLRRIHKDDEIHLTTLDGSFHYLVDSTQVVEPDDIKVLAPSADNILTLVSCYPFYFVGPAPNRFIVRAHRTSG
jgi:sortase A